MFNDFQIIHQASDADGLFILLGNFGNYNRFWKTSNEIQLIRLDNNLNELWSYQPNANLFPLEAKEITIENDTINVTVNVITGCHVCFNKFELKIDHQGNCLTAVETGRQNSLTTIKKENIKKLFKTP